MSRTTFYDDNRNRHYPFVTTDAIESGAGDSVPTSLVLDAGFQLCAGSGYDPSLHSVWLASLTISGSSLQLSCLSNAPGLVGRGLTFTTMRLPVMESKTVFAERLGVEAGADPDTPAGQLLWYGFLVLGDLVTIQTWLGSHSPTLVAAKHTFEPSLVQNLDGSYVRSLNLANQQRVRTTDLAESNRPYIVAARGLVGAVQMVAGYNCDLGYTPTGVGITIAASVGAGDGEPCAEVSESVGESSPDAGLLLSGGPTCPETIRFINGVPGPNIPITAGNGLIVKYDLNNPNLLTLAVDPLASQSCVTGAP